MPKTNKIFSLTKKDFQISFYSGSGAGGQHRNKHQNCVRIHHCDSGASATGADSKSKEQNLKNAFKRVTSKPEFKSWLKLKIAESVSDNVEINRKVDESMKEENLIIEYF